MTSCNRFGR